MIHNAIGYPLNCGVLSSETSYSFKKPGMGGGFFTLNANPIVRTTSVASSGIITQNDLQLIQNNEASTITDYAISIQQLIPGTYDVTIYSNNSEVILDPNENGIASGVNSGSTSLIAIDLNNYFSSVNVVVSKTTGAVSTIFDGYVVDSLAKEVSDAVDTRIDDLNATTAKPIYTTQNHTTSTYVRNTNCWVADLDLTPISPWNSTGGNTRAGVLISPRHILFAAHYQINNGATIRFVDNNNNVVTRTLINKLTHPDYSPYYPDIAIGLLDSDVPASIGFVKILPQNWANYLPSLAYNRRLPCLVLDQEEKALISELSYLGTSAGFFAPSNQIRLNFYENIIVGDSGDPAFLIINDELVIITIWTYGGAGSGTSISYHKEAINTMMTTLGGGYSLTEIDLSSFTNFGPEE
jgi:hypothetical protein